jgi:hypothetical protein
MSRSTSNETVTTYVHNPTTVCLPLTISQELVRRLLSSFSVLPSPTIPLTSSDASLLNVAKQLDSVPSSLLAELESEPEDYNVCPLHELSPDEIHMECASNLDHRLRLIQERNKESVQGPPEIRLESDVDGAPEVFLSVPESFSARRGGAPTNLVPPIPSNSVTAHQKHSSALLRLLYVHSCLNPGNTSPQLPSLLILLYVVLLQEIEPKDLAHVEADTFWLFEAMIGEFSELEDDEGGGQWRRKLSERLAWADTELFTNLVSSIWLFIKCVYLCHTSARQRVGPGSSALLVVRFPFV